MALTNLVIATASATTAFTASKTNQISIRYVPPKNPAQLQVYTQLKQRGVLEKLQVFLSPFRLPRTLRISMAGCDGEPDAFYEYAEITICYEYVDDLWANMPGGGDAERHCAARHGYRPVIRSLTARICACPVRYARASVART